LQIPFTSYLLPITYYLLLITYYFSFQFLIARRKPCAPGDSQLCIMHYELYYLVSFALMGMKDEAIK